LIEKAGNILDAKIATGSSYLVYIRFLSEQPITSTQELARLEKSKKQSATANRSTYVLSPNPIADQQ